jgi:hypothetical protein
MELINDIQKQIKEMDEQRQKLTEQLRPRFKEVFTPFLEKYQGKIGYIYWVQYTPYFNDGDECVFSTHEFCATTAQNEEELEEEDEYPYEGTFPLYYSTYQSETIEDADIEQKTIKVFGSREAVIECGRDFEELAKTFQMIPDDMLKDVLGDHVSIKISLKHGVEVDEYHHD